MKKLIAVCITIVLLFSVAAADSLTEFVERWNKAAPVSGSPEIEESQFKEGVEDSFTIRGDGWFFRVCFYRGTLFYAEIYSKSSDQLLAMCVTMGAAANLSKTSDDFIKYEGLILHNYLRIISGEEARKFAYGIFTCWFEGDDTGIWYFMDDQ